MLNGTNVPSSIGPGEQPINPHSNTASSSKGWNKN